MSGVSVFDDTQPRDLRLVHLQRTAIRTFGDFRSLTRIHNADLIKSNKTPDSIATQLNSGNAFANQKLTFSSPLSTVQGRPRTPETMDTDPSPKMHPSKISDWIKERQALRGMLDESTESVTQKFLAKKECNPLEKRYLAKADQKQKSIPISDPYSRLLMFYQCLMFNSGQKRVDLIKRFFSAHMDALGVRFRILDPQNQGFIPTEEMRNICMQFAKPNNRDTINEMLDVVEENGSIFYKCFLVYPSNLPDLLLYGNSKVRMSSGTKSEGLNSIAIGDQIIRQKRNEYDKLMDACRKNKIVLSRKALEKALLLPETRTMDDIIKHFTGISLQPPDTRPGFLYRDGNSSDSEEDIEEPKSIQVYLANRERSAKKVHLSTGYVTSKCKVDCWLTFSEYLRLLESSNKTNVYYTCPLPINSKRYLADPNAFWPGSYLDRQYSHLPNKPKSLTPNQVHFRQVDRHFDRADIPNKHGMNVWPTNEAGYVQYGSLSDKQCSL